LIRTSCKVNPIATDAYPTKAKRPKYSVLNSEKIKKEFNLNPRPWEKALEHCLKKVR
jgi:dTDP-4-dehydrorhamnose reductase